MKNILIVDDSKFILAYVEDALKLQKNASITALMSYKETKEILKEKTFHVAILDLNLPDAQNGEIIDLVQEYDIPIIVLTATMNKKVQKIILEKDILEYVTKQNPKNISYVTTIVKRVLANYDEYILIVDDSKSIRLMLRMQLEQMHINVIEAASAKEAISILETSTVPISMLITDYEMPDMNGIDLTITLRERYSKNQLSIIALSGADSKSVATNFLKHGANDFIIKPFTLEEFSTRVNINLDIIDLFNELQNTTRRDFLTGLYNRSYFFERAGVLYDQAQDKKEFLTLAMIEIDGLKQINEKWGHAAGDAALKSCSDLLRKHIPKQLLISRYKGERFCLLSRSRDLNDLAPFFEKLRSNLADDNIDKGPASFNYTISIGVCCSNSDTPEEMIKSADKKLYQAKEEGKNRVIIDNNCQ